MKKFVGLLIFILLIFHGTIFASSFSIIYHGSDLLFDQVEPRYTSRSTDGVIVWEGVAIFGTDDYRIALFYTHQNPRGYRAGIDLINFCNKKEPITYDIMGGNSEDEALEALWGSFDDSNENLGWIYLLDSRKFFKEPGLGEMEVISRDVTANIGMIGINRRKEIQHYIEEGLVKINWKP